MSSEKEEGRKAVYVYLGSLSTKEQDRFLQLFAKAKSHGVTIEQFVTAWNDYATKIEDHIFMTETPGTGQGPPVAV